MGLRLGNHLAAAVGPSPSNRGNWTDGQLLHEPANPGSSLPTQHSNQTFHGFL